MTGDTVVVRMSVTFSWSPHRTVQTAECTRRKSLTSQDLACGGFAGDGPWPLRGERWNLQLFDTTYGAVYRVISYISSLVPRELSTV